MIGLKPFERTIAWRYLKSRRRQGFLSIITLFSIIGIMLGVATLILVTSLMNGIRDEMQSRFIGISGHVNVVQQGGVDDFSGIRERVQDISGVQAVLPKVEGQVMLNARGGSMGAQVIAYPPAAYDKKPMLKEALSADVLNALAAEEGVVLGSRLAKNLGLSVGDSVLMIAPQGRSTIAGYVPRMKNYPIVGTIELGMHMYDSSLVIMPFEQAQIYFMLKSEERNAVSSAELVLDKVGNAARVAENVQSQLREGEYVYDWQRSNASLFAALQVQRNVMVVILALIVLVAVFNIISSLIMLVQDKSTSIAILRTFGVTQSSIMRIFCACGTWIGVLGTGLGLGLGLFLASNIEGVKRFAESLIGQEILVAEVYFLSTLPTKTNPVEVLVIVLVAIALSFLATLHPARKAASIHPAEALRYE